MKKIIMMVLVVMVLVATTGCKVTHETKVNSSYVINNIEDISESNR